ncbi:MAG: SurA N-terminal domain-containing protein [Anaerolineae bacterium]|nr:SurA N-terminal domain-containing protein [Thermoflexales bacterium]MDW8406475.1 SurA N-terminal domain-containing protein [Anaerolineae bacterium]
MPYKPKVSQSNISDLVQARDSRYQREQRIRRGVVIGVMVVAVLVTLLVAAFVVQEFVINPSRPVAIVGGQTITVSDVQTRMRIELAQATFSYSQLAQEIQAAQQQNTEGGNDFLIQFYQQQLQQIANTIDAAQIANAALDSLIQDALIRQEAQRRGIVVTPDEVQVEIERQNGFFRVTLTPFPTYTPAPTPTPSPTPTDTAVLTQTDATPVVIPTLAPPAQPTSISQAELDQIKQRGREFYTSMGYPESQFERAYESNLFAQRLQEAIGSEVPTRTMHYQFSYIRFNTVESATQGLQQLTSGAITFEALISQTNAITQPAVVGSGGFRDWRSASAVEQEFGVDVLGALDRLPLNQPSPVITSSLGGAYLLLPAGREIRDRSPSELASARQQAYTDWLRSAQNDSSRVQRLIDPSTLVPAAVRNAVQEFRRNNLLDAR